jgi:hypothetical protein
MDGIILLNKQNIIYKPTERNKKNRKEKINCACGGRYTVANRASHIKTGIHKNYISNNNNSK